MGLKSHLQSVVWLETFSTFGGWTLVQLVSLKFEIWLKAYGTEVPSPKRCLIWNFFNFWRLDFSPTLLVPIVLDGDAYCNLKKLQTKIDTPIGDDGSERVGLKSHLQRFFLYLLPNKLTHIFLLFIKHYPHKIDLFVLILILLVVLFLLYLCKGWLRVWTHLKLYNVDFILYKKG